MVAAGPEVIQVVAAGPEDTQVVAAGPADTEVVMEVGQDGKHLISPNLPSTKLYIRNAIKLI